MRRRRRGGQRTAARAAPRRGRPARSNLYIAPLQLCTDNAVMGAVAVERWRAGLVERLDLDALPGRGEIGAGVVRVCHRMGQPFTGR